MTYQQILTKLKLATKEPVLVAVSGGSDSMALLDGLYRNRVPVVAVYIDHQQRAQEVIHEKKLITTYCEARDIPFYVRVIDLSADHPSQNKQAFFREQRYALLVKQATDLGIQIIATGHHQDDQVATQLMRLVKNYDVMSYQGIRARRDVNAKISVIRPLLDVRKTALVAYCHAFAVPYVNDSSNASLKYLRNQFVHQVMPLFEAENQQFVPEFIDKMATFVGYEQYLLEQLRSALRSELQQAEVVSQQQIFSLINGYPEALQYLLVKIILQEYLCYYGTLKQAKIKDILSLINALPDKAAVMLDGVVMFKIQYGQVFLQTKHENTRQSLSMPLAFGANNWDAYRIWLQEKKSASASGEHLVLSREVVSAGAIFVRYPQKHDYLRLKVGKKRLNRLYIDEKVLPSKRFAFPVLVNEQNEVIYDFLTKKISFSYLMTTEELKREANIYLSLEKV